jgi:subtilisin family serine protease
MSTEDQNRAVVTLYKGVDVDAFIEDMVSGTNHNEYMPNRRVELHDEKLGSKRNVDFVLTRNEATALKNDPRVVDVRYGSKIENNIILSTQVIEPSRIYNRTNTLDSDHYNWAIPACTNTTNPFISSTLNFSHEYTITGQGVDVVIQDSGIDVNHPEWLNLAGSASRFNAIDWPSASGLSGTYTQDPNHYTDPDGHGTHVAGTVAGRLYGWAKSSNIYAISIIDNPASFGISASFNMIRAWHNLKTNGRPTVVNMSWGYQTSYVGITGGSFRGTPWSGNSMVSGYGMVQTVFNRLPGGAPFTYVHPRRVASVDADIEDCLDDGIILVGSAGNFAHKIDVSSGQDYNNFYNSSVNGSEIHYHRGSTPSAVERVVNIGSVSTEVSLERKSFFSNTGPRVDLFAPGEAIQSSVPVNSNIATAAGSTPYPLNNQFSCTKISGTSMAGPQAAGVIACLLEARPTYSNEDVFAWLSENLHTGRLNDSGGGFTDTASLQGAANKYLNQPYNRGKVFSLSR